jgi:intein/homing endonuclease
MAIILTNICRLSTDIRDIAMKNNLVEEIEVGDRVLSEDETSGEVAVKTVTETYVNETDELVHIGVNGETISATPTHPFYVDKLGWTLARSLRAGDVLVLSNGELVTVEWVQHEILESPIKVYNFEVEEFHTYFVGECGVLVHNVCQKPGGYEVGDVDNHGNLSPQKNRKSRNKNVQSDGYVQSHHVIQDEWAKKNNIQGYSRNKAPAVLLESESGSAHAYISSKQRERRRLVGYSTSLRDEFDFSYSVMLEAGVSEKTAKKAMKKAYKYFNGIGAI